MSTDHSHSWSTIRTWPFLSSAPGSTPNSASVLPSKLRQESFIDSIVRPPRDRMELLSEAWGADGASFLVSLYSI